MYISIKVSLKVYLEVYEKKYINFSVYKFAGLSRIWICFSTFLDPQHWTSIDNNNSKL